MKIYVDYTNKIIFILAPKCGNNTISNYLKVNLHVKYPNIDNILNNKNFKKIIILRTDIIDRFISGFNEDLYNNTCYNNMSITFNEYLNFLNKCFKNKIPNVKNMSCCTSNNIPVWFGNCSKLYKTITDNTGKFQSHIQSQKYAISNIVDNIKDKNIKLLDLKNLSEFINTDTIKNQKSKTTYDIDISNMKICDIKKQHILFSKNNLNIRQQKIISKMYNDDLIYINELSSKYKWINVDKKIILS